MLFQVFCHMTVSRLSSVNLHSLPDSRLLLMVLPETWLSIHLSSVLLNKWVCVNSKLLFSVEEAEETRPQKLGNGTLEDYTFLAWQVILGIQCQRHEYSFYSDCLDSLDARPGQNWTWAEVSREASAGFTPAEWCVSAPELLILQQLILSQIKGIRQAS